MRSGDGRSGYDYVGSLIYKREDGLPVLESALFAGGQLKGGSVDYALTDHLGSVRAIVDADGTVRERNDYYPFGSRHVNTGYASRGNRYLFSGKERQDLFDVNRYDFGARMYDSDIARWTTVDPLAEDYYAQSLFGYCLGNPVRFIDPNGSFATDFYDQYGELIVRTNDGSDDVVVVPEERLAEFKENVYWASSGMLNDPNWNAWWADEFKGTRSYLSSLSFEQLSLLERIDTAWGRRNAIDYWLNPTIGNYFVAQASIVLGQYTNPELLLAGANIALMGIGPSVKTEAFWVTREGVVLPKGAKIPSKYVESKKRSGSYGVDINGKYTEKLRIDPATPPGYKGPNISHIHLNKSGKHRTTWPWDKYNNK